MIRTETVFIVGAGASSEVELPLGPDLTNEIARCLDFRGGANDSRPKSLIRGAISCLGRRADIHRRNSNELFQKALVVSSGLATANSIDAFLDNHSHERDFSLLGKMAIAACLIEAERGSTLMQPKPGELLNMHNVEKTWYARLFDLMARGVNARRPEQIFTNARFVIFNYDRCLEHYFQHAIASRFVVNLDQAGQIVREHCRVVHPYGSLGELSQMAYGKQLNGDTAVDCDTLYYMANRLMTFTETQNAQGYDAKRFMAQAKRAVFLGFAFHTQNVELLRPELGCNITEYRATTFKMKRSNRGEILRAVSSMIGNAHGELDHLPDSKCCDLISDEELFLSR